MWRHGSRANPRHVDVRARDRGDVRDGGRRQDQRDAATAAGRRDEACARCRAGAPARRAALLQHQPPTRVDALRLDVERRHAAADVIGAFADPPAPAPPSPARAAVASDGDDPLLTIAPEVYVSRLLGVDVPRHRKVACPFHEDRHPSLHVYPTPGLGWYCYGRCRRGGTIYDLAAPLYGYTDRGEDFLRLRAELRRLFGLDAA